jgi:hypothetical protein
MTPADQSAFHVDERADIGRAWAGYASLALGLWLFVSAFLWPHSSFAFAASWIMGGCIAMTAFAAIWASPARYFNVLLGAMSLGWQLTAASKEPLTLVHGVIVSGLVIVLSFVPLHRARRARSV